MIKHVQIWPIALPASYQIPAAGLFFNVSCSMCIFQGVQCFLEVHISTADASYHDLSAKIQMNELQNHTVQTWNPPFKNMMQKNHTPYGFFLLNLLFIQQGSTANKQPIGPSVIPLPAAEFSRQGDCAGITSQTVLQQSCQLGLSVRYMTTCKECKEG